MSDVLIAQEGLLRLAAFASVLLLFAGLEALAPRRKRLHGRSARWMSNLGLSVANTLVLRLVAPLATVGAALWAEQAGFGLLHWAGAPLAAAAVVSVIALDLALYVQHRAMHRVPLLWRLHAVHHTDEDLDVTSAVRFHPVEILVSQAWKALVTVLLGAPAVAVLVYEILLNAAAMFHHANLALPERAERALSQAIVTPHLHTIHHSDWRKETDSNFGVLSPVWDRLFGTYRESMHPGFRLGLMGFLSEETLSLHRLLAQPFGRRRREAAAS